MKKLNLDAKTQPQKVIKEYLEHNASDTLADKINNGAFIQKDGQTLINKKTLDGFMNYATQEAQKIAEKGSRCACVQDSVVFGWAIHYFEEESIEEKLYNVDGSEYVKPKSAPQKNATKKTDTKKSASASDVANDKTFDTIEPIKSGNQVSFFDLF